jgi:beta-galactosidase
MFHGGTSFGFMNGANWRKVYEPDVTSYDYDSPLSESGALTKKYFAFRDVIARHGPGVTIPDPPVSLSAIEVPEFELAESAPLWANLPNAINVDRPRSMETFGQSYGYILYRTKVKEPLTGELVIHELRSYARIFINGKPAGTLDRRQKEDRLHIEASAGSSLDILVEGTGRINFTTELRNERQGINGSVILAGKELLGWQIFPLPMDDLRRLQFSKASAETPRGPAFYRGQFDLPDTGDTFLDTRGWGKGAVWVNGHALGRFWNLGPQQTLYLPAPWLRKGANEVVVFAQDKPKGHRMRGLRTPVLDELGTD